MAGTRGSTYFSIDQILMEQEGVPSTAQTDMLGLGMLGSDASLPNLPAKAKVDMPLWLARPLAVCR